MDIDKIENLKNRINSIERIVPIYISIAMVDYGKSDEKLNQTLSPKRFGLSGNYQSISDRLKVESNAEVSNNNFKSFGISILNIFGGILVLYLILNLPEYYMLPLILMYIMFFVCSGYKLGTLPTRKQDEYRTHIRKINIYKEEREKHEKRIKEIEVMYKKKFIFEEYEFLQEVLKFKDDIKSLVGYMDLKKKNEENGRKDIILKMDPFQFEHYIADFFRERGFKANVSAKSNDGGIDIILENKDGKLIPVQCKRYNSTVGSPDIQRFLGVLTQNSYDEGYFVTSNYFSSRAAEIAMQNDIRIFTIDDISHESDRYKKSEYTINKNILEELLRELDFKFLGAKDNIYHYENCLSIIRRKKKEYEEIIKSPLFRDYRDIAVKMSSYIDGLYIIMSTYYYESHS